jgi:hypothetical protein
MNGIVGFVAYTARDIIYNQNISLKIVKTCIPIAIVKGKLQIKE